MITHEARLISVTIAREWRAVYEFLAMPENWPRWAAGLGSGLQRADDAWTAQGPQGPIRVRFSPPNPFGVLDHVVTTEEGAEIHLPVRVVANGTGSEVVFVLFRQLGMDDAAFAADANAVQRDLETLKALLERRAHRS